MRGAKNGSGWRAAAPIALQATPWIAMAAMGLWLARRPKPVPGLSIAATAPSQSFDIAEPHRGRSAATPLEIPHKGWKDVLWRTWREINADRLPAVAGGVTFYALLALFPAIGVFVSLYGLFADVAEVPRQLARMGAFVPKQALDIIGEQMLRLAGREHVSLGFAFAVSLLLSVWSANAGMKALFDGLNIAYDEDERRSFLKKTALTYAFTAGLLVFITLVSGLLVSAPILLRYASPQAETWLWLPLRDIALVALAALTFSAVYRYGPSRQHARWRWVWTGGIFAAVVWLAGSLGFSWYVDNVGHFDVTYGSLGTVIGFMLWIWFTVMVILVGAELNAEIEHQTARDSTTGPPLPMGERGAAMADTVGLAFHFDFKQILKKRWTDGVAQTRKLKAADAVPHR